MSSNHGLTLGHIPYLNCVPYFRYLAESGFSGTLVSGVPSKLNLLLQQGELDISPSSSFEYARNWQDYQLLPGYSISSLGKVHSVLLFSPVELAALDGEKIAITGESATSVNLLRILLREFEGLRKITDEVPKKPVEELIRQGRPALLIGDRALHLADNLPDGIRVFDLGEIWYQRTGLPFVFALWMIRRSSLSRFSTELADLSSQLQLSLDRVLGAPETAAVEFAEKSLLTPEKIVAYWRSIDYRLTPKHLEGLQLFFKLCVKHKLLEQEPALDFFRREI